MTLVVDASVALKWFVSEPGTEAAAAFLAEIRAADRTPARRR